MKTINPSILRYKNKPSEITDFHRDAKVGGHTCSLRWVKLALSKCELKNTSFCNGVLAPLVFMFLLTSCAPQPTVEVPPEFKAGQKYFHKTCSNCHGSDAMGKHTKAPRLIDVDYLQTEFSDDDIRQTILNGTGKMPPQKDKVSEEGIKKIIEYLRYSQQAADLTTGEDEEEGEILESPEG